MFRMADMLEGFIDWNANEAQIEKQITDRKQVLGNLVDHLWSIYEDYRKEYMDSLEHAAHA